MSWCDLRVEEMMSVCLLGRLHPWPFVTRPLTWKKWQNECLCCTCCTKRPLRDTIKLKLDLKFYSQEEKHWKKLQIQPSTKSKYYIYIYIYTKIFPSSVSRCSKITGLLQCHKIKKEKNLLEICCLNLINPMLTSTAGILASLWKCSEIWNISLMYESFTHHRQRY